MVVRVYGRVLGFTVRGAGCRQVGWWGRRERVREKVPGLKLPGRVYGAVVVRVYGRA